jgi:hypothetical protein
VFKFKGRGDLERDEGWLTGKKQVQGLRAEG